MMLALKLSLETEPAAEPEFISIIVCMKLDLAGCKISLRDWQAIPIDRRQALHEMDAETDKEIKQFRRALEDALREAHRPLPRKLPAGGSAQVREWKYAGQLPHSVAELDASGALRRAWPEFDRFGRYFLCRLAAAGDIPGFRSALRALRVAPIRQLD